jgi:ATP-dependent RNA/DNA helicase IGHMBP2
MTTQFKTPTADLQHQYDLLQKEFEYEKEMYRQQIEHTAASNKDCAGILSYQERVTIIP